MSKAGFTTLGETTFDAEVGPGSGLTVLDFWAEGCVPCRQLSRVLVELAPSLPDNVRIATVNVQDNPALVARFNIATVPTLLFLKDGTEVDRRTGVDRRQVIKKIVETHI